MRWGSVCTGYGGLDMAATALLGGDHAWFADVDTAASKVLAHHWPGVPNLGDISAVDWSEVEPVDGLTGGTPCQDLSAAGKRAGMRAGTRSGLWHAMCDAIEVLRPRLVLWENVRGALSAGSDSALEPCPGCLGVGDDGPVLRALGRVLGDLADLGYDAVWCGLPASAVGCAHQRWRVFVAACPRADAASLGRGSKGRDDRVRAAGLEPRDQSPRPEPAGGRDLSAGRAAGPGVDWREYTAAIRQHELMIGRPAPAPTIVGQRGGPKLSPWFTEWLMGLPAGLITGVPGLSVNDQLRLCGNGVVRQQAIAAYRYLLPLLDSGEVAS